MTWEQKLEALQAIAECDLKMRKPGDWYVSQSTEIKDGPMLCGYYGNGASPQEAVENHWEILTKLDDFEKVVVVRAGYPDRKHVRWNGFMWKEIPFC